MNVPTHHRIFGPLDAIVIILMITGAALFFPLARAQKGDTVAVYHYDKILATYPLSTEKHFNVRGDIGKMAIEIRNGKVRVNTSSCLKKICVYHGWIQRSHDQIICAPNRVMIEIQSATARKDIDAVSR
ncbi:MAG: hypothetical protein GF398_15560 [Chitinivibrionales bacterium]|nr:hypothetical protein [Chitinivibrionales bacterium]